MTKWEDIVKHKMEEFDEPLPESVLAEFHARQNSMARKPVRWVWAVVPAVAAAVAAILLLYRPAVPETSGGVQLIEQQPPVLMVEVTEEADTVEFTEPVPVSKPRILAQKPAEPVETLPEEPAPQEEPQAQEPQANEYRPIEEPVAASPFIPDHAPVSKPVRMKVAPAAGIVAGTGLLAAVITPLVGSGRNREPRWLPS